MLCLTQPMRYPTKEMNYTFFISLFDNYESFQSCQKTNKSWKYIKADV